MGRPITPKSPALLGIISPFFTMAANSPDADAAVKMFVSAQPAAAPICFLADWLLFVRNSDELSSKNFNQATDGKADHS